MTYDSYPNFAYCLDDYGNDLLGERRWSRNLSLTRSISPVFGIMEQQSGANGWNTRMLAPTPRPGQMTLWAMQSIAHGAILTEERTALLEEYVASGGVLVMGCRTGYKDTNGRCVRDRLPGLAAKLTGTDIPEYSLVAPDEGPIKAEWDGESIEAAVFTDMLRPLGDARVLASYENGCFAGEAALIDHSFGAGRAYYFGGAFSPDTAQVFLRRLGEAEPYGELIELPACCELAVRRKGDVRYLFVLNYGSAPCTVRLHKPVTELLSGAHAVGEVTVEKYGVRIYRTGQMPDMEG